MPFKVCLSVTYGGSKGGGHLARVRYYLRELTFRTPIAVTLIIDNDSVDLLEISNPRLIHEALITRPMHVQEVDDHFLNNEVGGFDLLLIDRCEASPAVLKLVPYSKKVVVISDSTDNPYLCIADLLVDFNYGAEQLVVHYQQYVRNECRLLLGWTYAPIKPDLVNAQEAFDHRWKRLSPPWEVLISMGSEDPLGFTEQALVALQDSCLAQDVNNVKVVEGPLFNRNISYSDSLPLNVLSAPQSLQEHYASADLCISTGGVSTWERLCANLPTRLVPYSDLQRTILMPLHEMGLIQLFPDFASLCSEPIDPQKHLEQIELMGRIPLGSKSQDVITSMLEP